MRHTITGTETQLSILCLLQRYRCLPSTYICEMLGLSYKYCKNFIFPVLHREGYICWPPEAQGNQNARYRPRPISITDKAEKLLKQRDRWVETKRYRGPFLHGFMGDMTHASFELAQDEHDNLRLITGADILRSSACPPETKADARPWFIPLADRHIEPDDEILGYEYTGAKTARIFFTREDDRSTEPLTSTKARSSMEQHLDRYMDFQRDRIYKARFGIPNCMFIWHFTKASRMASVMELLGKMTGGKASAQFLFKTTSELHLLDKFPEPTGYMATADYLRVGHAPYNFIDELRQAAREQTMGDVLRAASGQRRAAA